MTASGWVLVTGAGPNLEASERVAATQLGALLAREGYGLISGTWGGVDECVTREFVARVPSEQRASRIVHVENHGWYSKHDLRVGRIIKSSAQAPYSPEAVELADVGVVVGGRDGSKPTMDALIAVGKPVIPLAWLGHDAFACLQDLLRDSRHISRGRKQLLMSLVDPACDADETISRVLGAVLRPRHEIFLSYHREDAGPDAGRLATHLAGLYGTRRVFIDYASLPPAAHVDTILANVRQCRLVIALIGPQFVTKVQRPDDYVRQELSAVTATATVLPVLVDTVFRSLTGLPDALQFLLSINAVTLDRTDWNATMLRIEAAVDNALGVTAMRGPVMPY